MDQQQGQSQQSVPEAQVSPQIQQQVTPDLVSPQGKQQLASKLSRTIEKKGFLDYILKGIATKVGAEFSSRVKNPETVIQKVATKRMAGRKYNLDDVNDAYGGRFVIKNSRDVPEVKGMLRKAADLGVFKIGKTEERTQATYHAYHMDITTKDGVRGEIQIMTHPEAAEAVVNHDLRSVYGEKPSPEVARLRDVQAKIVTSLSDKKNSELINHIQNIHKQAGDKPLPPTVNAAMLAAAKA
ncbi:MAG: nucleotidyltransferase family protein [Nitrosotalea sp.]